MRRVVSLYLMVAASTATAQGPRVITTVPGFAGSITMDTAGVWRDVPASHQRAYEALITVFDALKIPLTIRDSSFHVLGNLQFSKSRSLGGMQMSRFFECGLGLTGPNADTYRITMAITLRVEPVSDDKSRVRTGLVAGAQNLQGNAYDPVRCATTGGLEALIQEKLLQRLAASR